MSRPSPSPAGTGAPGASPAGPADPFEAFFALAAEDQLVCARSWPLKTLGRIRRRAADLARLRRAGGDPDPPYPLARPAHLAMAWRYARALDLLAALVAVAEPARQLARVAELSHAALADLLYVYVRECVRQGGRGLPCEVHALMLGRLHPRDYVDSLQPSVVRAALATPRLALLRETRPDKE
jgi:hypothetical protein